MAKDLAQCIGYLFLEEGININVGHIKVQYHVKSQVLVVFGSDDIKDWLTSFNIWCIKGFHAGYYLSALLLQKKLESLGIEPRLTIGYSIGGAIVSILSPNLKETIAIGSPRYLYSRINRNPNLTHVEIADDWIINFPIWATKDGKKEKYHTRYWSPVEAHRLENYIKEICNH